MTIFPDGAQIVVMTTSDETVTDETVWTEHSRHDRICEAQYSICYTLPDNATHAKLKFVSGIKKKKKR